MTAVITGVGVVSAFGVGAPALFGALTEGRSGIGPIRSFDASTFPTRVAGEVPVTAIDATWLGTRLESHLGALGGPVAHDRRTRLVAQLTRAKALRDRKIGFALLAAAEAWHSAGCGEHETEASLSIALGLEQAFLEDFAPIFAADETAPGRRRIRWDIEWVGNCGPNANGPYADGPHAHGPHAHGPHAHGPHAHGPHAHGPHVFRPGALGPDAFRSGGLEPSARSADSPLVGNAHGLVDVRYRSRVDLSARAVAELLGLRGPVVVNSSACAAGTLAIAHAASLIERGAASVVVCGAADSMVNPLGLGGMCRLGAPSPRNEIDACRPFDRARDGLVIGEGAAMFVVEREERARARNARILARIIGWGSTQDAYRVTAPRPDGSAARRAMERALARAKLSAEAIGYINAHGTGTPLNDPAEAKAIHGALGADAERVPVSSIKGAVGHLMAAAGAIELAASLLAFERDLLPGTAHHRDRDPECPLEVIGPAPRPARVDAVLSNSFGFGGQNASVILGRPR